MQKTVKLQFLGLKGTSKNLSLTKDVMIPFVVDGHIEVDAETAELLMSKFNLEDQEPVLVKEGDPLYSAPKVVETPVTDNIHELKDELLKVKAQVKVRDNEIADLKKDLDKIKSEGGIMPRDVATNKLKKEIDALRQELDTLQNKYLETDDELAKWKSGEVSLPTKPAEEVNKAEEVKA